MTDALKKYIKEILSDFKEILSDDCINELVNMVEGCYENKELVNPTPPNPLNSEISHLKEQHKKEIEKLEKEYEQNIYLKDDKIAELGHRIDNLNEELFGSL